MYFSIRVHITFSKCYHWFDCVVCGIRLFVVVMTKRNTYKWKIT